MKYKASEQTKMMWCKMSRFMWTMGYHREGFWCEHYYKPELFGVSV